MVSIITLFIAFGLSVLLVPLVRKISLRRGRVAAPRQDRWHSRPTPTSGGIAIFAAFVLSLLLGGLLENGQVQIYWGLLIGSAMVFTLGLVDDLVEITPPTKLVGQILAASIVVLLGYTTRFFTPRIPNNIIAQIPNILLTFVWLVGITNAINLLDNMDGLAGGISIITAGILSFFFWKSGDQGFLLISLAMAGSILGFLVYNFPPASIFMGDSGSLFLGFTLAALAIARQPQASNVFAVMGVPTLLFLLPILDTTLVTFTRLLRGQSPAQGGRDHTSHRLIAFGLNERQAVLVLYGVAIASGVVATVVESLDYDLSLVLVPILIMALAILTAYLGRLKVVTSAKSVQDGAITRLMAELTYKRRIFEIILDFFLISATFYLAFWTRFGLSMNDTRLEVYLRTLPIALAGSFISFFFFGVYRGMWRYVGIEDLLQYIKATIGSVIFVYFFIELLYPSSLISPVIFLLFATYLFLGLAASRSSFKILDQLSNQQARPEEQRVIICGAGDAGEIALRWILMNPQIGYRPVGFLDDDPFKAGRKIHGVPILGGLGQLESILNDRQIDGVVITSDPNCIDSILQGVISITHQHGRWVRTLRLELELVE
jgi:UDP-GlcNAc:undecaprenyl-phosphate GlcNAc-1-phosphate transferase